MSEVILSLTGVKNPRVLVGPQAGLDTSVISIDSGEHVIIASMDPVSLIPEVGAHDSARLSVHTVASDVATSGVPARFALFDLNLPTDLKNATLREYWTCIHETCERLGISIVGGHTGRFPGCELTIVGGATMFTAARKDGYVTSAMAQDDDDILVTKSAALEAVAVLSNGFPEFVGRRLGKRTLQQAKKSIQFTSTVADATVAATVGLREKGVTAMHDATEGGILSAILDVADASQLTATVNQDAIPVNNAVRQVCQLFQIDPLYSLGQGSLIIASRPNRTSRVIRRLKSAGISASLVGRLTETRGPSTLIRDSRRVRLTRPASDPYWNAYWRSVRSKLR